ncbi:MAG: hypothetical protein ACMXX5_01125, partial [Candidatus Woesearchaeota archaeon]
MDNIIAKLHNLERKVLPFLEEGIIFEEIVAKSRLKDVEVMRALQWLSNKNLIVLQTQKQQLVFLDENGKKYAEQGLPEKRFLKVLLDNEMISSKEIMKKANLNHQEFGVSIGVLKSKVAVNAVNKDKALFFQITEQGKKLIEKPGFEEMFLKKEFPLNLNDLKDQEKFAFDNLMKRKSILRVDTKKIITVNLTSEGKNLIKLKEDLNEQFSDNLTRELIVSGKWKDKKFRSFDININVPQISGGKRHFVKQSI